MALTKVSYSMIAGTPANIVDFGAVGNGTTDDTAAIQAAINSGAATVYFPPGTYKVTAPINITQVGARCLIGAGQQQTIILGSGTFSTIFNLGDNVSQLTRGTIRDMQIAGSGANINYGIYGTRVEHWSFLNLWVVGFKLANVTTGYGYCNNFIDCEFSYGAGDGLWLNKIFSGGGNNAIEILGCRIFANDGFGIKMENGYGIYIDGATIEANKKGGIFNIGCQAVRIAGYFESNGTTGHTFATPSRTVKADIILNGSSAGNIMSSAFPSRGVVIEACQAYNPIDAFIYNAGAVDTVVNGCTTPQPNTTLWLEQYEDIYKGAGVTISRCDSFETLYAEENTSSNKLSQFSSTVKIVDSRKTSPVFKNYAKQNMNEWSVLSGGIATTFSRSDDAAYKEYQGVQAFQIATAGAGTASIYGFTLEADDYPELIGKLVYFGVAGASESGVSFAPYNNQLGVYTSFSGTDWGIVTSTFTWPASGTIQLGFYMTGSGGKAWVAGAILAPVGYPITEAYGTVPQFTKQWYGSAAPVAGTWERGDVVINNAPSAGGTPGWVCVTAGTPGTWKAMANVAA